MFVFGSEARAEAPDKIKAPGPGQYMAKTFTGHEGSRFSMGQTLQYEPNVKEKLTKPGPGAYSPDSTVTRQKESAWKIGKSSRQDLLFEKMQMF